MAMTHGQATAAAKQLLGAGATLRSQRCVLPEAKAYVAMFYVERDGVICGVGNDYPEAIDDCKSRLAGAAA